MRILILLLVLPLAAQADEFRWLESKSSSGQSLRYRLLRPSGASSERRLPLVLCLHGRGGNTTAAGKLAKMQARYPCFVLAPQCANKRQVWASPAGRRGDGKVSLLPAVLEVLRKHLASDSIDPRRVYVTGQSMGGYGTWGALVAAPDLFAAGVPVCGGWAPGDASKIGRVPLWLFHGAKDPTVPVARSREMVSALKALGRPPKYTEYPDVKHNAWQPAYDDARLWTWLFAQRRPADVLRALDEALGK